MTIETDAIIMDGKQNSLGIISCAPGVVNPTEIAKTLLLESALGLEPGGLIRPCSLSGNGVIAFAKEHNLLKPFSISTKRQATGQHYLEIMKRARSMLEKDVQDNTIQDNTIQDNTVQDNDVQDNTIQHNIIQHNTVQDTVGCIILSDNEIVAAGSSGGNWMRRSGCGGLCSIPGAGVWCDRTCGCISSGLGVVGIRHMLAHQVCTIMQQDGIDHGKAVESLLINTLTNDLKQMKMELSELFGVIGVRRTSSQSIELVISHTSEMFGYGYVILPSFETPSTPCFHIELSERTKTQVCTTNTFYS